MRHDQPHPGKFEGNGSRRLSEALYNLVGDGCASNELGDVEGFGWYGLIARKHGSSYIVSEDSQGFFGYNEYDTEQDARKDWKTLEAEYAQFEEQCEKED